MFLQKNTKAFRSGTLPLGRTPNRSDLVHVFVGERFRAVFSCVLLVKQPRGESASGSLLTTAPTPAKLAPPAPDAVEMKTKLPAPADAAAVQQHPTKRIPRQQYFYGHDPHCASLSDTPVELEFYTSPNRNRGVVYFNDIAGTY